MFGFLNPLSLYAKLAAAGVMLALLAGVSWKIYGAGEAHVQAKWDTERIERGRAAAKAVDQRIAENVEAAARFAVEKQEREKTYENELETVRTIQQRDAGRRVPVASGYCRPGPAATDKAAGAGSAQQAAAGTWFLPDAFARDLRQLAARADEVVADARAVQGAVKSSGCF